MSISSIIFAPLSLVILAGAYKFGWFYISHPKEGICRPWQKGDETLDPYEPPYVEKTKKTPQQKLHANVFYGSDRQEDIVISLLSKYFSKFVLQKNLKDEYGWSIEPPKNYKQVYKQQELFAE